MKTYTFTFDNTTRNNTARNNFSSANYSSIIDDIILANIKKNNPYLFEERTSRPATIIFDTPKKKSIDIDITINKPKTERSYTFDALSKAIKRLANYRSNIENDIYDFKLEDGTPVKLFCNEIQIGYDLIPLNNFTKKLYDSLSESSKKNIIDIYIKINKD